MINVIINIITNKHLEVALLRIANNANIPKENSIAAIRTAITRTNQLGIKECKDTLSRYSCSLYCVPSGSTAFTYPEKMNVIANNKRHKFTMIFLILLTEFDNAEH